MFDVSAVVGCLRRIWVSFGREVVLTALKFSTPSLGTRFRKQFHRPQAALMLAPCLLAK
jgi:hypothetical protein